MTATRPYLLDELYERSAASFDDWELIKEIIDESIDLALNYRQSGHPGGSRSKVHMFVSLLLSGAMRWHIRRPWRPFGDRCVLGARHTVPAGAPVSAGGAGSAVDSSPPPQPSAASASRAVTATRRKSKRVLAERVLMGCLLSWDA